MLVRPLAIESTWAILEETVNVGGTPISHRHLCTVRFDDGPIFLREQATPAEYEPLIMHIRQNFDRQRGELAPEDVSMWLVKIAKLLQAVPLRDTGGIYFVPRPNVDRWQCVAKAIESVSAHQVFQIPAMKNDEAIAAITDAITQEAEAAVANVLEKLGDLGDRALKTRRESCDQLLAKISAYDQLLGVQLKCRERVEELQQAIAAAALVAGEEAA